MKNIFLLFLLVALTPVKAQKYIFNTLSKYSIPNSKTIAQTINYTNSYNDNYFLTIKKYQSFIEADLYDYENLKVHNFRVTESKIDGEVIFTYDYNSTSSLYYFNKNDYSKYVYDFETIEANDSIRKVRLDVYQNSKKKKSIMTYHLEIKDYASNLFPIFRISCMHGFGFVNKLNSFENGIVISAKGNTLSGEVFEYKLTELKQVLFELNIPKK